MKAFKMSDYIKEKHDKMDPWTTSVTLEKRHEKWIEDNNFNLSKFVRDCMDNILNIPKVSDKTDDK